MNNVLARLALAMIWALIGAVGLSATASAHQLRPAIVSIDLLPQQRVEISIKANVEALLAKIDSKHKNTNDSPKAAQYNKLRALPADELRKRFMAFSPQWLKGVRLDFSGKPAQLQVTSLDIPPVGDLALGRISKINLAGKVPAGAVNLQWSYAGRYGSNVMRVTRPGDDKPVTQWLKDGATSKSIPLQGMVTQSRLSFFIDYIALGLTHIVPKGIDHILFVLGLYLLSTHLGPLLWQVTAFTVAHSITLALGVYGVLSVPPTIVEPLIAISIVYVAVENILTSKLSPWRPLVVFAFGLLHGLGFASVIREIGLPRSEFVTGLVGFNVGVELGQLSVIAIAFFATGLWFRTRSWYRARIIVPGSLAIALVGLYWTVERIFFV